MFRQFWSSLVVLALLMCAPGCSAYFFNKQKVTLNFHNEDVSVKIYSIGESVTGFHSDAFFSHASSKQLVLPKNNKGYSVTLSKKGYRTKTYIIKKSRKLSTGRVIETGGSVLLSSAGMAIMISNGEPNTAPIFMFVGGLVTFCNTAFYKGWLKYRNTYDFDPLVKNPVWDESLPKIFVDSTNIKIDKNGLSRSYFPSIKDYEKNKRSLYATSYDNKIILKNTNLSEDLNGIIRDAGFQDSISEAFRDLNKYCRLSCDIKTINMIFAGSSSRVKMNLKWTLLDYYTQVPYAIFNDECETEWESAVFDGSGYSNTINTGLKESLYDLLSDEKNVEIFRDAKKSLLSKGRVVATSVIDSVYTKKRTIGHSAKAVVTIITRHGHGSGCVVSPEGYIISNYHVVENDTTGCKVMLSSGEKLSYEIVAIDPGNDLALIRVRKKLDHSLSLSFRDAAIGEEVYAIGTPADIELGQTVTRGVISGYREINTKKYYQTDASINSGNSGGALITKNGELVGIVNAKVMGADVQGIGFAIPLIRIKDKLVAEFK